MYVFNCSPEMDYKGDGEHILTQDWAAERRVGLPHRREFNRLIPEVLSVHGLVCTDYKCGASLVVEGRAARGVAIKSGFPKLRCVKVVEVSRERPGKGEMTTKCQLDSTCGAYITMNPGYLGRSALPEGLKALFRPMTVMVPDLVLICENMLMAQGFVEAKSLASKFYGLIFHC